MTANIRCGISRRDMSNAPERSFIMDETSLVVSAALAPFLPLLISLLKRPDWPPVLSMALTGVAAFGVAVLGLLIGGQVDLDNGFQDVDGLLGAAGLAFAESQIVYRLLIKGTAM